MSEKIVDSNRLLAGGGTSALCGELIVPISEHFATSYHNCLSQDRLRSRTDPDCVNRSISHTGIIRQTRLMKHVDKTCLIIYGFIHFVVDEGFDETTVPMYY